MAEKDPSWTYGRLYWDQLLGYAFFVVLPIVLIVATTSLALGNTVWLTDRPQLVILPSILGFVPVLVILAQFFPLRIAADETLVMISRSGGKYGPITTSFPLEGVEGP